MSDTHFYTSHNYQEVLHLEMKDFIDLWVAVQFHFLNEWRLEYISSQALSSISITWQIIWYVVKNNGSTLASWRLKAVFFFFFAAYQQFLVSYLTFLMLKFPHLEMWMIIALQYIFFNYKNIYIKPLT